MSDHRTPDDPFERELGARMRAAADPVAGDGVTRAGVAAAAERHRPYPSRRRTLLVGAAAAVAVLGGIAVAARTGSDRPQRVTSGGATTTAPCVSTSIDDPAGWFRLTGSQADQLLAAGVLTGRQAAERDQHAVLLTHRDLEELDERDQDLGRQLFQLGYGDPAGIFHLMTEGLLTGDQVADVAAETAPVLDQSQVDRLMAHFPDLVAVTAGGEPLDTSGPAGRYESGYAIVEAPSATTSVPGGKTPFEEWVEHLRSKGLLTPEQEAEVAAGRGFSLTAEQSAAMQEYWDQQAAATTTAVVTAPAPAASTPSTTRPDPCAEATTTTTEPGEATTSTTSPPATSTTVASGPASEADRWALYLYVLDGRRNPDGTIASGLDRMKEILDRADLDEQGRAEAARAASAGLGLDIWEGELTCDVGAAEALGLDPALGALAISVTFDDEASAGAAFEQLKAGPLPDLAPPVPLAQACSGRDGG